MRPFSSCLEDVKGVFVIMPPRVTALPCLRSEFWRTGAEKIQIKNMSSLNNHVVILPGEGWCVAGGRESAESWAGREGPQ